ncbi:CaiB/BaiF CoA transferase family protein [Nocardia sp. FBN12]|uniref:CaiB/BaiF CoA transferase family protein n=1 Tax=Nocardia sp. FBN12 TaxID=3419766 RepID=UPI003CFC2E24
MILPVETSEVAGGSAGPLEGLRVLEMAGLAPVPFGAMMLADLGAQVLRIDRASGYAPPPGPLDRGKESITVDLKSEAGAGLIRELAAGADVFLEGYRPGVAERLGIGPEQLLQLNPRLIYGRMTGWGQDGPLAARAGHDINYIGLSGVLDLIGRRGERPVPPVNIMGDFAGGGMLLAFGVLSALYERERSGRGQVVDAAMVDGSSLLSTFLHGLRADGLWERERGDNMLDGGAAYYDTYETSDGKHMAVGAVEPEFFFQLTAILEIDDEDLGFQIDPTTWPAWRERLAAVFRTKTRDEWAEIFADVDACVSPVLSPWEAHDHPHNIARSAFIDVGGVRQPAPAPRFDRTPTATPRPLNHRGTDPADILAAWGVEAGNYFGTGTGLK